MVHDVVPVWPRSRNIVGPGHARLVHLLRARGLGRVKNVACVWPPRSKDVATSCHNVTRGCVEILRAFGQAFKFLLVALISCVGCDWPVRSFSCT